VPVLNELPDRKYSVPFAAVAAAPVGDWAGTTELGREPAGVVFGTATWTTRGSVPASSAVLSRANRNAPL